MRGKKEKLARECNKEEISVKGKAIEMALRIRSIEKYSETTLTIVLLSLVSIEIHLILESMIVLD